MPLLKIFQTESGTELAVWEIRESEEDLLSPVVLGEDEKAELALLKSPKARVQWAACRRLMRLLHHREKISIIKDEFGKPHIAGSNKFISLSHTEGYAGVIISDKQCGVDVHKLETRIEKIAPKFINKEEWKCLLDGEERLAQIHLFWSAKEALYKFYGKKLLDFREHMHIKPFIPGKEGILSGTISKGDYRVELPIFYHFEEEYLLAYTL